MINILLIILIIILLIFFSWISSFFFGAPFQPSSNRALKEIIELAKIKKGQKTADLGSGNGKIVIEFAKQGAEAHGFEINPFLVWISRRKIKKAGLQKKAFIHWKNFFKQDFSKFGIITSFQISYIMPELECKLKRELKEGAKVISNTWKFPNWKPKKRLGDVYLYLKN
ncbi:MAG: methyltransferase domain-containing protein [Candidatus Nanoarchaeia archaeon]